MNVDALQDNVPLLERMMADMSSQSELHRPSPLWADLARDAAKALKRYGLSNFRYSGKATAGAFPNITDAPMLSIYDYRLSSAKSLRGKAERAVFESGVFRRILLDRLDNALRIGGEANFFKYYRLYRDHYVNECMGEWFSGILQDYDIPNAVSGGFTDGIKIRGHVVAPVYLVTLARIFNFHDHFDFRSIKTALIIGGGFGYEAHLIMSLFPNVRRCITLDIPPTLYVQTQYLRAVAGARIIDYAETAEKERICFSTGEEREILAIAPWQLEKVDARVDLLWNSCSFQEMTKEQVENYALISHKRMCGSDNPAICLTMYGDHPLTRPTTSRDQILDSFRNWSCKRIPTVRKFWPLPPSDESYEEFNYIGRKRLSMEL